VAEGEIPLAGLAGPWDGARILLLTDLHAGPFLSVRAHADAWKRLASLEPDLVLLGGDFITTGVHEILPHAATLRAIRAPLGVYGVLGNHDHYGEDPARLLSFLASCGVGMLENESTVLRRAGAPLTLCGIDDWNAGRPDLDRALGSTSPHEGPAILLSHNPDAFFEAERRGVALTLSGHTHGGQVRLPRLPVLVRMSRYRLDEGRYAGERGEIVVSRGFGVSGLPLRAGCPPEAVLIRLRARPR
jgi:predicted MPP superfamily phosphohydrolase